MAYKLSIGFETLDPDRRDQFLESLIDLIDEHRRGADKATIKLAREAVTGPGGKRKIIDEQTIDPGQPMPDLSSFGLTDLTPIERAIEQLRPKAGDGLESVTLSGGGHSTRLEPRR